MLRSSTACECSQDDRQVLEKDSLELMEVASQVGGPAAAGAGSREHVVVLYLPEFLPLRDGSRGKVLRFFPDCF